jgi:hypothetical protein
MSCILHFRLELMFSIQCLIILLLIIFISTEKVCPSYGNMGSEDRYSSCFDQCSPDNDQCESNKKCCFFLTHPCGHRCIIPKDNRSKSGICPSPNCNQIDILWSVCDIRLCDVDNDCPDKQKCCSNKCNTRICLTPISTRKKCLFVFY